MRMPRLTADASLLPAVGHYNTVSASAARDHTVVPQLDAREFFQPFGLSYGGHSVGGGGSPTTTSSSSGKALCYQQ